MNGQMTKNLVILCCAREDDVSALKKRAFSSGSPAATPASGGTEETAAAELGMAALAGKYLMLDDEVLPTGWAADMQDEFDRLVAPMLQHDLDQGGMPRVVSSPFNAFLVDAWRSLCRRNGVPVRFVYVRRLEPFPHDVAAGAVTLRDFNVALAMARQAGPDISCFHVCELEASASASTLGRSDGLGELPAASLARAVSTMPSLRLEGLPAELQLLMGLYVGRHQGSPLVLGRRAAEALRQLEGMLHPRGALAFWLRQGGEAPVRPEVTSVLSIHGPAKQRGDEAWLEALEAANRKIDVLQAALAERDAIEVQRTRGKGRAAKAAEPSTQSEPPAKAASKARDVEEAEASRSNRLWRKFKKNPQRFFADSKNPVVRSLQHLVRA